MLNPSSSEEEDSETESVAFAATAVPIRQQHVLNEDDSFARTGSIYSQTSSFDQLSLSIVSHGSSGSGDNLSLVGGATSVGSGSLLYQRGGIPRSVSPSPSLQSSDTISVAGRETELERTEREEEERRCRIQLYVFVLRCIAYPFNAKQPSDMVRRQAKVSRQQLQSLKERFQVRV